MALDEPGDGDIRTQVARVPFVMKADEMAMVGSQRDIRVEYLPRTREFYAATTLAAECIAWFADD